MSTDVIIKKYMELREALDTKEKAHKADILPIKEAMERIELHLLGVLTNQGAENMRSKYGTVYKTKKTSATVADKPLFLQHIIDNQQWELLDVRALKTAIETFKEEREGELPPGINWREETTVNVRKS